MGETETEATVETVGSNISSADPKKQRETVAEPAGAETAASMVPSDPQPVEKDVAGDEAIAPESKPLGLSYRHENSRSRSDHGMVSMGAAAPHDEVAHVTDGTSATNGATSWEPPKPLKHAEMLDRSRTPGIIVTEEVANRSHLDAYCEAIVAEQKRLATNTSQRPLLSYARLAVLAIVSCGGRAKVTDIYEWIEAKFPFYCNGTQYWKNCIRHNLSMKKFFERQGCSWTYVEEEDDKSDMSKANLKNLKLKVRSSANRSKSGPKTGKSRKLKHQKDLPRSNSDVGMTSTTLNGVQNAEMMYNQMQQHCHALQAERGYYELLGCSESATTDQITTEYKQLCQKLHPDKNGGTSTVQWLMVQNAYRILSDPEIRPVYDSWRHSGLLMTFGEWMARMRFAVQMQFMTSMATKQKPEDQPGPSATQQAGAWQGKGMQSSPAEMAPMSESSQIDAVAQQTASQQAVAAQQYASTAHALAQQATSQQHGLHAAVTDPALAQTLAKQSLIGSMDPLRSSAAQQQLLMMQHAQSQNLLMHAARLQQQQHAQFMPLHNYQQQQQEVKQSVNATTKSSAAWEGAAMVNPSTGMPLDYTEVNQGVNRAAAIQSGTSSNFNLNAASDRDADAALSLASMTGTSRK